ncbi:MAG: 4Fe-4S dicluster domain-containing protein [Candidatus Bathyarchaeia archaeon]
MSLTDLMSMAKPDSGAREKVLVKIGKREFADCFQCTKCTSGCTAFKLLELKPHEVMRFVNLGFTRELISSEISWTCVTCLKCMERCPQRSSPYYVIMALRNLTVEQGGKVPEAYLSAISQILETGLIQTVQKVTTKNMETLDREKLGLPPIRYPAEAFKAAFLKALVEHEV